MAVSPSKSFFDVSRAAHRRARIRASLPTVAPAGFDQINDDIDALPDPDLLIRTSGEMRISNFLIWQGAYAEWYVTPTLWPDFTKEELFKAIEIYDQRDRRFGNISSSNNEN